MKVWTDVGVGDNLNVAGPIPAAYSDNCVELSRACRCWQ